MNTIGFKGNAPQQAAKKPVLGTLKNLLGQKPAGKPAHLEEAGDSVTISKKVEKNSKK